MTKNGHYQAQGTTIKSISSDFRQGISKRYLLMSFAFEKLLNAYLIMSLALEKLQIDA